MDIHNYPSEFLTLIILMDSIQITSSAAGQTKTHVTKFASFHAHEKKILIYECDFPLIKVKFIICLSHLLQTPYRAYCSFNPIHFLNMSKGLKLFQELDLSTFCNAYSSHSDRIFWRRLAVLIRHIKKKKRGERVPLLPISPSGLLVFKFFAAAERPEKHGPQPHPLFKTSSSSFSIPDLFCLFHVLLLVIFLSTFW